jgi:hypothetical protein
MYTIHDNREKLCERAKIFKTPSSVKPNFAIRRASEKLLRSGALVLISHKTRAIAKIRKKKKNTWQKCLELFFFFFAFANKI